MLRVRVSTASAEIIETELITAGRRGLECSFEFNSAWDGLAKTVIVNGVVKRDIVLVSDTIVVPGECLAREQFPLRIGVYGANGAGEIVIPTIWANFGKILPSARPSGVSPDEVTPDIVAQIQTNSSNALRLAQDLIRRADSGDFDGRDGATGPSGADGADGLNGSSIWTVAAEDVHGGTIRISDLVGRTGLTPAKNDLILDGDWNIYRIDLVGRSTVSATRFGNVGEGGGASGVFVAQYGVSTADEIYEASTGGNACILPYAFPGVVYYLSWLGEMQSITPSGTVIEKSAVFTGVDGDEKTTIRVTGSTWFSPSTVKYARSASPTFTGTPKAPTAASGTNTTQLATTAFVQQEIAASAEVFWATYNTTTEAEITAAVTAGKAVLCKISDEIFYLASKAAIGPSGSAWIFASANQTSMRVTWVSGSYWNSIGTRTIPNSASDIGAIAAPSSPATGAFLVWNGTAWAAQTLATWQGGNY